MYVIWKAVYTGQAVKDRERAYLAGYREKIVSILFVLRGNPFAPYPPYEKLCGDLEGFYSRRINRQHRVVYQVYEKEHTIKIVSIRSRYD
ncbi:MAG: Txe/YoeB family addiction module toxin [Synergistaceae bacterium]|nr:Txe/YoeB family addiction module toxin [Synergistaceae bacterium]